MRISDWSSDVCSSDLIAHRATRHLPALQALAKGRSDFVSPRMKARLMATSDTVSFGYEQVPAGAKTAMVGEVFSRVARKSDIMNDAMSGGLHRQIGRAHVCTPVTNAHLVCSLLLAQKNT